MIEKNIHKFLSSNEPSLFKYCKKHNLSYKIMKEAILQYEIKDKSQTITNKQKEYKETHIEHCLKVTYYI